MSIVLLLEYKECPPNGGHTINLQKLKDQGL